MNPDDVRPVIIIDTREQTPLSFSKLDSERGTLTTGDYSVKGLEHLFAVERKSLDDFTACCKGTWRDRFERELHRLRGFHFKRIVVTGTENQIWNHEYRSQINPKSVMNTARAFEVRYEVPFLFYPTSAEAASAIESWAFWFAREQLKNVAEILMGKKNGTKL